MPEKQSEKECHEVTFLSVLQKHGVEYLCLQEHWNERLQKWARHCLRVTYHLLYWETKPSPDTTSQEADLLSLPPFMCHFPRTRHFSHFWCFADPDARLHTSSCEPQPRVMQTWSCSLPYMNNSWWYLSEDLLVAPEAVWLTSALWDSFPHSSPTGRSIQAMEAVYFAHQVSQPEKVALKKCHHE